MRSLLLYELRSRRGAVIGWGIGISLYAVYVIALFPQFAPSLGAFNLDEIAAYQAFGDFSDISSFVGYLDAMFSFYLPLLLAIYAITNGTGTLAGEEDDGTLEIVVAQPLHRWQLLLVKFFALAVALLLITVIVIGATIATFYYIQPNIDPQGVGPSELAVSVLASWPLVLLVAAMSFFLGAFTPRRRLATIIVSLYVVVSFFGNNLAALSEPLERFRFLFAFHYFNTRTYLEEGLQLADTATLLGAAAVLLVLALWSFQRRNIMVGAWPWEGLRSPSA
jgi:ABC-2 type transport system permease protein